MSTEFIYNHEKKLLEEKLNCLLCKGTGIDTTITAFTGKCSDCNGTGVAANTPVKEERQVKEDIANILRDNVYFSGQLGDYVIHGAIEKIVEYFNQQAAATPVDEKGEYKWTNDLVLEFAKQYRFSSSRISIEMFMAGKHFPITTTPAKELEGKQPFENFPELANQIEWIGNNVDCPLSEWSNLLRQINKAITTHPNKSNEAIEALEGLCNVYLANRDTKDEFVISYKHIGFIPDYWLKAKEAIKNYKLFSPNEQNK